MPPVLADVAAIAASAAPASVTSSASASALPPAAGNLVRRRAGVLAARRRHDLCAARGQPRRDGLPDPARGAGHERNAACQINHMSKSSVS